jgi:membrane protein YdbS with pleckstrin-like domain
VYLTPAEIILAAGYGLLSFYHSVETAMVSLAAILVVTTVVVATITIIIAVTLLSFYYFFPASAEMETTAAFSANRNR